MTQTADVIFERQGVRGVVLRWSGNQMPGIGRQSEVAQPVQTAVWVFVGRIASVAAPRWAIADLAGQQPFRKASSNAAGEFSVQLPAGEYTLFAQYGDDLYLNMFSADGSFASVVVEPGQWVDLRLENTEAAVF